MPTWTALCASIKRPSVWSRSAGKRRNHPQKYDLGECEFHLALKAPDYEAAYAKHKEMGCVCFENPAMGIYFISDPDGYWIEIIP